MRRGPFDHVIARMLGRRRTRVIGQNAQQRADRKAQRIDRPCVASRDDAVLLIGRDDDEIVVECPPAHIAHEAVTLIQALGRSATVAR